MPTRTRTTSDKARNVSRRYLNWPVSCANLTEQDNGFSFSNTYFGHYKQIVDEVTPNFRRRSKAGEKIFNPLTISTSDVIAGGSTDTKIINPAASCSPPLHTYTRLTGSVYAVWSSQFHDHYSKWLVASDRVSNLQEETWSGCQADRQKGFANFVETFAEAEKTWRMVGSPLENAHKFVREFRRTHRQKKRNLVNRYKIAYYLDEAKRAKAYAKALGQFASSEWLRFRYGIKPFMSDISAGIKACSEVYDIGPKIYTSRKQAQVNATSRNRTDLISGTYTIGSASAASSTVSVRAMCMDSYRMTPFTKVGLTFHNVVGVAWELTKFSFVLDWFGNVGDLIYANLPRAGCVYLGGCTTTRYQNFTYWYCDKFTESGGSTITSSLTDTVTASSTATVRNPRPTGSTSFVFRDDFRFDNWVRASDAISLLLQQLNRVTFN